MHTLVHVITGLKLLLLLKCLQFKNQLRIYLHLIYVMLLNYAMKSFSFSLCLNWNWNFDFFYVHTYISYLHTYMSFPIQTHFKLENFHASHLSSSFPFLTPSLPSFVYQICLSIYVGIPTPFQKHFFCRRKLTTQFTQLKFYFSNTNVSNKLK